MVCIWDQKLIIEMIRFFWNVHDVANNLRISCVYFFLLFSKFYNEPNDLQQNDYYQEFMDWARSSNIVWALRLGIIQILIYIVFKLKWQGNVLKSCLNEHLLLHFILFVTYTHHLNYAPRQIELSKHTRAFYSNQFMSLLSYNHSHFWRGTKILL